MPHKSPPFYFEGSKIKNTEWLGVQNFDVLRVPDAVDAGVERSLLVASGGPGPGQFFGGRYAF
jgi:hypothetical protein